MKRGCVAVYCRVATMGQMDVDKQKSTIQRFTEQKGYVIDCKRKSDKKAANVAGKFTRS